MKRYSTRAVQASMSPDTGDHLHVVVAHHGECPALVAKAHRGICGSNRDPVCVLPAFGMAPRVEYCTHASLNAALPLAAADIAALPDQEAAYLRDQWLAVCEAKSVACQKAFKR